MEGNKNDFLLNLSKTAQLINEMYTSTKAIEMNNSSLAGIKNNISNENVWAGEDRDAFVEKFDSFINNINDYNEELIKITKEVEEDKTVHKNLEDELKNAANNL